LASSISATMAWLVAASKQAHRVGVDGGAVNPDPA